MNENQTNQEPGNQQNQPLQDNQPDNQSQTGTYQKEGTEINDRNSQQEFPERTHQHDYKDPSANESEDDEKDEVDTEGEVFNKDDENKTYPPDKQPTDVSDLGLV